MFSKRKTQQGEILTALTLISLAVILVGTIIGAQTVKYQKTTRGNAQESCLFSSTLEIRDKDDNPFKLDGVRWENSYGNQGVVSGTTGKADWNPDLTTPEYKLIYDEIKSLGSAQTWVKITLPPGYEIISTFPSQFISSDNQTKINALPISCEGRLVYGWRVRRSTEAQQQTIPTQSVPTVVPTVRVQPTRSQVVLPTQLPTPTPAPCSYDTRYSVKDEQGTTLSNTDQVLLDSSNWYWYLTKNPSQKINFTSPNKTESIIHADKLFPHPLFKPGDYTSLTLALDPAYEVVDRRINYCGSKYNRSDFQCQNTREGKPTNPDVKIIDGIPVACNMQIDLDWIIRKKAVRVGNLIVKVELSAGGDMSKNIPFTTRKVPSLLNTLASGKGDDFNPYDGRSTITVSGLTQYQEPFTRVLPIRDATMTFSDIPIGQHSISYNFPSGVMATRDKNSEKTQVYRLNSPPIDGTKVNITSGGSYSYRVIYNINTAACKAVRNSSSCTACGGNSVDDIQNPSWPNPDGKTLCCPEGHDRSKFSCSDDYDSRCIAGTVYYGNCGHKWGPGDQDFCPQSQRAKFTCTNDRYYNFNGCVESPGNMDRCAEPSPTPAPTSKAGQGGITGVPSPLPTPGCGSNNSKIDILATEPTPPLSCPPLNDPNTVTVQLDNPSSTPITVAYIGVNYNPFDVKPKEEKLVDCTADPHTSSCNAEVITGRYDDPPYKPPTVHTEVRFFPSEAYSGPLFKAYFNRVGNINPDPV